jgi:hypothetical protein
MNVIKREIKVSIYKKKNETKKIHGKYKNDKQQKINTKRTK